MFKAFSVVLLLLVQVEPYETSRTRSAFAFSEAQEAQADNKPATDKCPDCYGSGFRGDGRTKIKCPTCNGTGKRTTGEVPPIVEAQGDEVEPVQEPEPAAEVAPVPIPEDAEPKPDEVSAARLYGVMTSAETCSICKVWPGKESAGTEIPFQIVDRTGQGEPTPRFLYCDRLTGNVVWNQTGYTKAEELNKAIPAALKAIEERREANQRALRSAVVRIRQTKNEGRNVVRIDGSAFVVEQRDGFAIAATAAHVVDGGGAVVVLHSGRELPAAVAAVDKTADCAVIVFGAPDGIESIDVGDCEEPDGVKMQAAGFPDGKDELHAFDGSGCGFVDSDGAQFLVIDQNVPEGVSGGPITIEGTAVAVVSVSGQFDAKRMTGGPRGKILRKLIQGVRIETNKQRRR